MGRYFSYRSIREQSMPRSSIYLRPIMSRFSRVPYLAESPLRTMMLSFFLVRKLLRCTSQTRAQRREDPRLINFFINHQCFSWIFFQGVLALQLQNYCFLFQCYGATTSLIRENNFSKRSKAFPSSSISCSRTHVLLDFIIASIVYLVFSW